jgi:lipoprotein-releasing system permease protein
VLLGTELAKKVGAETGKPLRIMSVRTLNDGRKVPRTMRFNVRGIVASGYHEIDSMWCLISYEDGKRLLDGNDSEPYLIVKIDDPYKKVDEFAMTLTNSMQGFFYALTWKQVQPLQYSSYEQTRQILLFIMAFIVLIAAVNVSSAVSMLVIERQRDIAVLKAFGTGQNGITFIFLTGSLLTAISGGLTGTAAGLFFGSRINEIIRGLESFINFWTKLFGKNAIQILDPGFYLETIPIVIHWPTVGGIGIFTIFCAIAASALPACRAGKTKPVELLRKAP